jgi:hypothetical protein
VEELEDGLELDFEAVLEEELELDPEAELELPEPPLDADPDEL